MTFRKRVLPEISRKIEFFASPDAFFLPYRFCFFRQQRFVFFRNDDSHSRPGHQHIQACFFTVDRNEAFRDQTPVNIPSGRFAGNGVRSDKAEQSLFGFFSAFDYFALAYAGLFRFKRVDLVKADPFPSDNQRVAVNDNLSGVDSERSESRRRYNYKIFR